MATKPNRGRKNKAEVQLEFEQLAEANENEKRASSPKMEMAAQIQEAEIRAAVSEISVEAIARKLGELSTEISRTLSNLSEKMGAEVNILNSLKGAIAIESKELEVLHGKDIAATSLDQLISDHQEKRKAFEEEIGAIRQDWHREKEEASKGRIRENEEFEYKRKLERKKDQDAYDEECRLREKQNREMQESLEKSWKERESALKSQEEELIALKKEVEQFPARLSSECSKAAKEASKEVEAKYNQEIVQLKRDLAVEKQISDLKIKQLQELLGNQQAQMSVLQTQLEEAKRQVQDIAVKAIEGASGSRALSHINQIAMEQAKNRPQS